jgi:hypothetical protein
MKLALPKMDKLLNDKNVLYVVFVVAILNILGYLLVQNIDAVAFFLIIGFLSTYFSKNMIVVLIIAIVSTSIFNSTRSRYVEGMSTQRSEKNKKNQEADKKEDTPKKTSSKDADAEDKEVEPEGMTTVTNKAKKPNKLDYAGTLEKAYENLQNTVGKGGIEGLTSQTKTLLDQQKNLMDNIKGMEPFLQTAESFMNKLDLSSLEGLGGMLSKFTGKKE